MRKVRKPQTSNSINCSLAQKHFLWTMDGPDSSYSCLEIHICWKVEREARMEPPIHTEYFLSGGAMILIFIVGGANAVISFCMRSAMPVEQKKDDSSILAHQKLISNGTCIFLRFDEYIPHFSISCKDTYQGTQWNLQTTQCWRKGPS